MKNEKYCIKAILLIALLAVAVLPSQAFAQTSATLGGRVMDSSQAVINGAEVTAVNVDTGVETRTTSNDSGLYNFPSLQPGTYRVSAQAPGFQIRTVTDVRLRAGGQASMNFDLTVAGISTAIEVSGIAESMVLDAGSSTGTVLQEQLITELPLVSNDVMDLINIMGGVIQSENPIFSNYEQTFAGVQSGNINVSRDGISVSEVRWTSGIVSPSRVNSDVVGEFKMILSPVDAELGRGAGQVQIITRSGSNSLHGTGAWNIQNTALDAREWEAKRTDQEAPWRNLHNYTISVGGPIIRNKTFFFATWDQQIVRERSTVRSNSLTNCARLGIYRYFDGWVNANALDTNSFNPGGDFSLSTRPTVNVDGTPRPTYTDPISGYTVNQTMNDLRFESVMGALSNDAYAAIANDPVNCTGYASFIQANGGTLTGTAYGIDTPWSSQPGIRDTFDASGYVQKFNAMVPKANVFDYRDGMNIGAYKWTRTTKGNNTVFGTGQDGLRKAISVKIDHNINAEHRLSGTYNYEYLNGEDSHPMWDTADAFGGNITRKPQSFTIGLTSTLKPTLLNEFRFGLSRTYAMIQNPYVADPEGLGTVLHDLLPISDKYPVPVGYDGIGYTFGYSYDWGALFGSPPRGQSHPFGSMGMMGGSWGGVDHRWTASDTMTWIKGTHSFKGGFEIRLQKSTQETDGEGGFQTAQMHPSVGGGAMSTSGYVEDDFNTAPGWAGMAGDPTSAWARGNYTDVQNLLNYFAGSVQGIRQYYYTASAEGGGRWNNILNGENRQSTDLRNREFAFFFKDDWRVTNDLTLNLGVRYEYYGVPWENNGITTALVGGSNSIWGAYGSGSFDNFMPSNPGSAQYRGDSALTRYQFVGPNSPNPGLSLWNKDMNNFAPHVGFSWQLPWFGKGLTTLRGGYSISYTPLTNFDGFGGVISKVSGTQYVRNAGGTPELPYLTLQMLKENPDRYLPLAVPDDPGLPNPVRVLQTYPVEMRSQSYTVYDDNIRNPYVQNVNLSLTRQLGNIFTIDVRYIGTFSRKMLNGVDLNAANFVNNGLFAEFAKVRNGGDSDVINALIPDGAMGICIPGIFCPNGSEQLRTYFNMTNFESTTSALAQGNFNSLAGTLATTNGNLDAYVPEGVSGAALRNFWYEDNSFGFPAQVHNNSTWKGENTPENLIYANPQLSGATLTANRLGTNYHSMQAQVTMRPVRGLSFQTTYTWSRNLARQGITDYNTMNHNYYLSSQHRSHTLNSYGSYELPLGMNGFVFRDAAGAFKKAVEGWQLSWILSMTSGLPASLSGSDTGWGDGRSILERPDLWNNKSGKITAGTGDDYMSYFFDYGKYIRVPDIVACSPNLVAVGSLQDECFNGRYALAIAQRNPGTGEIEAQTYSGKYTGASGITYNDGDPIIVVRNALPTETGNADKMSWNSLTGPGRWNFDMAMSKSVEFMEGKRIEVRVDAQNIFNHPMPSDSAFAWNARFTQISNPDFGLNTQTSGSVNPYTFGRLQTKGGHRTFQAKIRLSF